MNKYLIKLANHLDKKGLHKEADYVDWILKSAQAQYTSDEVEEGKKECMTLLNELEKSLISDRETGFVEYPTKTEDIMRKKQIGSPYIKELLKDFNRGVARSYRFAKGGEITEKVDQVLKSKYKVSATDAISIIEKIKESCK